MFEVWEEIQMYGFSLGKLWILLRLLVQYTHIYLTIDVLNMLKSLGIFQSPKHPGSLVKLSNSLVTKIIISPFSCVPVKYRTLYRLQVRRKSRDWEENAILSSFLFFKTPQMLLCTVSLCFHKCWGMKSWTKREG